MQYKADFNHLNLITQIIKKRYKVFANKQNSGFCEIPSNARVLEESWFSNKSVLPFKKILFPNGSGTQTSNTKFALIGLALCDIAALNLFLKQFSSASFIPKRKDILIIGGGCTPNEHCFCDQFDLSALADYDLFVEKGPKTLLIHAKSWRGNNIVEKVGLKRSNSIIKLGSKVVTDKIDLELTKRNIEDKELTQDFWQKISNNCFGCGACTAVCPLCYCFDQNFSNDGDGNSNRCLNWTSCFSDDFSQIQFGYDLRPQNSDRLYNWYHHKFVRGPKELKHPLCVGCGRCITACPANLNIKNIIASLNTKYPS